MELSVCWQEKARKNSETSQQEIDSFLRDLKTYDSSMGLSQISTGKSNQVTDSKFGPCQLGLYLFYQISYTESNFKVIADLSAVQRKAISADAVYQFPQFPLNSQEPLDPPDCLTEEECKLFCYLQVDKQKINAIESITWRQSESDLWKKERQFRFTASNFLIFLEGIEIMIHFLLNLWILHQSTTNM